MVGSWTLPEPEELRETLGTRASVTSKGLVEWRPQRPASDHRTANAMRVRCDVGPQVSAQTFSMFIFHSTAVEAKCKCSKVGLTIRTGGGSMRSVDIRTGGGSVRLVDIRTGGGSMRSVGILYNAYKNEILNG
ncbi:hypothetical protein ElyMa_006100400 [Elysia marginata]|uniref:Uncharacterized protein n=1 Tax=Elysia marginata TaxID=1093978 RepID=A0AAV4GVS4_9GAST|nr:hypothetical protein ElyMa_006100400 [Elysia marginata]